MIKRPVPVIMRIGGGVVYPLGSCGGIGNIIKRMGHFLVV